MITFSDEGIFCKPGNFYIDPWKPVEKALITHGHSDHARWGSKSYLCHKDTVPILKIRLGQDVHVQGIEYGKSININEVDVTFFPAGHIIGSAQIRLSYKGEVWVISGDYKLHYDGICPPYEPVRCHHFITESTFGLPIFNFEPSEKIYTEINEWWENNTKEGYNTVLLCYALGKSQTILNAVDQSIGKIYLHGAVYNVNQALQQVGYSLPGQRINTDTNRKDITPSLIVAPPSALGTPWLKKLNPYRIAICSGWMTLRGARRRYGVDRGFVLSDHCDWQQLNTAIINSEAQNIYITHGYESAFARWVREHHNLQAFEVKTLYHDLQDEDL